MAVMGVGIFPSELNDELHLIAEKILNGDDLRTDEKTAKHADWVESFILEYDDISDDNIMEIIQTEVGKAFIKILENCSVFKRDEAGQAQLTRFINTLQS
jgi:UDPglucose--hexose-1-phosphate uridylyltransferase